MDNTFRSSTQIGAVQLTDVDSFLHMSDKIAPPDVKLCRYNIFESASDRATSRHTRVLNHSP